MVASKSTSFRFPLPCVHCTSVIIQPGNSKSSLNIHNRACARACTIALPHIMHVHPLHSHNVHQCFNSVTAIDSEIMSIRYSLYAAIAALILFAFGSFSLSSGRVSISLALLPCVRQCDSMQSRDLSMCKERLLLPHFHAATCIHMHIGHSFGAFGTGGGERCAKTQKRPRTFNALPWQARPLHSVPDRALHRICRAIFGFSCAHRFSRAAFV